MWRCAGLFGAPSHTTLSWADRCTAGETQQDDDNTDGSSLLNVECSIFQHFGHKEDEMRLCGGK